MAALITIEHPAVGASYSHDVYGVYRYDTYGRGTVLAGQERRSAVDFFDSLEDARAVYPRAEWNGEGWTGYVARPLVDPAAGTWAAVEEPWDDHEDYDD